MKRYAPILTLVVVAALGAVLLVVNAFSAPAANVTATAPVASSAPAEPAAVEPAPAAEPPPPPPAPPPPVVAEKAFAGRSSGNEVTVAVAVKDGRAVAYVCDGKQIEAWLEGSLVGDQLTLTGTKDPTATLSGTVTDAAALGSVAVAGKQWPYAAKAVQAPGGIYEGRANVRGVATRIGWIVEGDGQVTGNSRPAGATVPQPAPAFDPAAPDAVTLDGVAVAVSTVGGDFVGGER
jgi:hypothetical protein